MDYLKEFSRSLREHGVKATLANAVSHLKRKTVTLADLRFDMRHGVDTCGLKSIHDLDVDRELKPDIVGYEATPVRVVRTMLRALPVNHSDYTFIDYGSGKGRVLLLASEYPYKRILGVELSPSLHESAVSNLAVWKAPAHGCQDISSLNANATEFELPAGPLVLFFFTPFFEPVLAKVVDKIEVRLKQSTNGICILYYGARPELVSQFNRLGLDHEEIRTGWVLSATGNYAGHLFSRAEGS